MIKTNTEEYKDNIQRILDKYGIENQLDQLIEESSELILAIRKFKRYRTTESLNNMLEEMADVCVMIDQMKLSGLFPEAEINQIKQNKAKRQVKRIGVKDNGI